MRVLINLKNSALSLQLTYEALNPASQHETWSFSSFSNWLTCPVESSISAMCMVNTAGIAVVMLATNSQYSKTLYWEERWTGIDQVCKTFSCCVHFIYRCIASNTHELVSFIIMKTQMITYQWLLCIITTYLRKPSLNKSFLLLSSTHVCHMLLIPYVIWAVL